MTHSFVICHPKRGYFIGFEITRLGLPLLRPVWGAPQQAERHATRVLAEARIGRSHRYFPKELVIKFIPEDFQKASWK